MQGKLLFEIDFLQVHSKQRIGLIGRNGSGKTTLLQKILAQKDGVVIPDKVKIGYFSQHLTILNEEQTILENVQARSYHDESFIRTVLARMHFWDEDVYKSVGVLSGGEKVKVALAKIFLSDVNVLVLDEPTTFLDLASLEALETLMEDYPGTIIFVTHDRALVGNIATKILEIKDAKVTVFDGNYEAYEEFLERQKKTSRDDELLLIETKISDVLSRMSTEPSEELEEEFQRLLAEKKKLM